MSWRVVAEPEGNNPGLIDRAKAATGVGDSGKNAGGMIIYVTDGSSKKEVSRVAWIRRNSKNPKVSFEKQLKVEIDKAREAVRVLEDLLTTDGALQ